MKKGVFCFVWLFGPIWAIGISAYLMFAPLVKSVSVSQSFSRNHSSAQTAPSYSSASWYETKGFSVARPLLIPIILSFLPLIAAKVRTRRIVGLISVVSLSVFCVFTVFSIGRYYAPTVLALVSALIFESYARGAHSGG